MAAVEFVSTKIVPAVSGEQGAASSNDLVGQIHNRMPAILEPASYNRWLSVEPNPLDLLITYPSEPMTMWSISMRVSKPENDDPSLLDRTGDLPGQ